MSGYDPDGPLADADLTGDVFDGDDGCGDAPWTEEVVLVEADPLDLGVEDVAIPAIDAVDLAADLDADASDVQLDVVDYSTGGAATDAIELPPDDAHLAIDPTWGDPSDEPVQLAHEADPSPPQHEPSAPVIYEDGSLVSQVPVAADIMTVEDVTGSDVYRQWEAAGGDAALLATSGGLDVDGSSLLRPSMVGDSGDVNFWFQQNSQFSCGPSSAAQIISDFTGVMHADESALIARAQAIEAGTGQEMYDASSGMTPNALASLLDDQGVPSTVMREQDFGDIEQYLREGRAVVMFVDARDVRPEGDPIIAQDQPENTDADTVDHFVRVIGIDRAANVAILADPGYAGGQQMEIPLDQLEEAWNDNTNRPGFQADRAQMLIVSDAADPTADDAGQLTTQPQGATPPGPTPQPQPGPTPQATAQPGPTPQATAQPGPVPQSEPATPPGSAPTSPGDPGPTPSAPSVPPEPRPSATVPAEPAAVGATRGLSVPNLAPLPAGEVSLPSGDAAPGLTPVTATAPAADDDGLFDTVPGWVIIPVTLAAGRIGMALRNR